MNSPLLYNVLKKSELEAGDAAAAGVGLLNGGHDEARFVQIFLAGHEDAVQRLDLPRVDDGLAVEAELLDEHCLGEEALLIVDVGIDGVQRPLSMAGRGALPYRE